MAKIKKNLSDTDMLANWQEETTFENAVLNEEPIQRVKPQEKQNFNSSFLTPELQEKIGKAILELKVELYKDGLVEFDFKVTVRDKQILLIPVPSKKKKA